MNKILKIALFFLILSACSISKNSKFWTSSKKIEQEPILKVNEIILKEKSINLELNPSLKIKLFSKPVNKSFINNFDNNNGRINFDGLIENSSRLKYSKIKNFYQYDPVISFDKNNIIFFNKKGTILKFNDNSKLVWKKNYYSKSEKKLNPVLLFANNKKILVIVDNITKYYAINIKTGELLWSKNNRAPFNSQVKIYKDNIYVVDYDNTLKAYSINNGDEIWSIKTQKSFIRSQKKLSLAIKNEKIYFNNSLGDISSVDINNGNLIWQIPTQSSLALDTGFFLKTSDIVVEKNALFFSNNQNEFFSLDAQTGNLNWKQEINSNLRPVIINDLIFTVTLEGYLVIVEKNSGNIVRSNYLLNQFKEKKRPDIEPTGFIIGNKNIYLSNNIGRLSVIDIATGVTKNILKIDNKKISRPAIFNKNLYIISNNSIIKLD